MGAERVLLPLLGIDKREGDSDLPCGGGHLFHRLGLRPFGALGDLKLDLVAFLA